MLQSDRWIQRMALEEGMIKPFTDSQIRRVNDQKVISYGLSSYGYDICVSDRFKVFTNVHNAIVDPKSFTDDTHVDIHSEESLILPPNSFALAFSVECFDIPRNVLTLCIGKSTYARCGVIVNVTPLEPEWKGVLTIEISNTTPLPVKIYSNEGIAQLLFLEAKEVCNISYADRLGKYMKQKGITAPVT